MTQRTLRWSAVAAAMVLAGCGDGSESDTNSNNLNNIDADNSAPVISLIGAEVETIGYGSDFNDGGVEVSDDTDDNPTVTIAGQVNPQRYGDYLLTYTATDASGNSSSISRTVTVLKPKHQIKADFYDTCVFTEDDGQLRCWGYNDGSHGNGSRDSVGDDTAEATHVEICRDYPEQTLSHQISDGVLVCDSGDGKVAEWLDGETLVDRVEYCETVDADRPFMTRVEAEPFAQCQYGGYGFYYGNDDNQDGVLQISDMEGGVTPAILPNSELLDFDIAESMGCGVFADNTTRCWGSSRDGALGRGDDLDVYDQALLGDALVPVDLGDGLYATEVHVSGANVACAVLNNQQVKCWGNGNHPVIGHDAEGDIGFSDGTLGNNLPAIDFGLNPATAAPYLVTTMEMGINSACAVLEDGKVKCWGYNHSGALGLGESDQEYYANPYFAIGDEAEDMGDNLGYAQLGDINVIDISLREHHVCTLTDDNQIKCWGENRDGQLGIGDTSDRGDGHASSTDYQYSIPRFNVYQVTQLTADNGGADWCPAAPNYGGVLVRWGEDSGEGGGIVSNGILEEGEVDLHYLHCDDQYLTNTLTDFSTFSTFHRVRILRLGADYLEMGNNLPFAELNDSATITKLSTSYDNTCALFDNGRVKCWGEGNYAGYDHDLDYGAAEPLPISDLDYIDLGTDARVVDIDSGGTQTCVVFETAQVKCWGGSEDGELGYPALWGHTIGNGEDYYEMGSKLPFVEFR